ncbi:MAG: heptaprenyl diphosphate synthase, partial [Spirochaetes bacterium]|nr:heptaprenyl diphosphate synthase [Spirochaetota bacterium]
MAASTRSISERTHLIALLAAFCLFLSMIEYLIPKPVPFMRIGLANVPVLVSLLICKPREVLLLIFLKVLGQGLVNGTLFSYIFLFSAAGSFASGVVMLGAFLAFRRHLSLVGVCMLGALASNLVQILMAREIVFGRSAVLIGPPLLLMGAASG